MSNPRDARRRWFGLFFLFVALGLVIWGQTVLKPHLRGMGFVVYWLACFGFTILALLTALLDLWIVRSRSRAEHQDLLRTSFKKLETPDSEPPFPAERDDPPAGHRS